MVNMLWNQIGWECPKCGRVWSPYQMSCLGCDKSIQDTKECKGTSTIFYSPWCPECHGTCQGHSLTYDPNSTSK